MTVVRCVRPLLEVASSCALSPLSTLTLREGKTLVLGRFDQIGTAAMAAAAAANAIEIADGEDGWRFMCYCYALLYGDGTSSWCSVLYFFMAWWPCGLYNGWKTERGVELVSLLCNSKKVLAIDSTQQSLRATSILAPNNHPSMLGVLQVLQP